MGASNEEKIEKGESHASGKNNNNNNNNNNSTTNAIKNNPITATSSADSKPKKRKPMQHLLAGGTAGLVESSVCHPLDTIKTRMQLRRHNTMKRRALGSMREVAAKKGGDHRGGGALHRTSGGGGGGGAGESSATNTGTKATSLASKDGSNGNNNSSVKSEAVRVKPDLEKAKSNTKTTATATATTRQNAPHDVGWKQRLPSGSSSSTTTTVTETASKTATSTITSSAAKNAATSSAAKSAGATSSGTTVVAPLGPFGTARRIAEREGPMALYKGLTAVYTGIIPKMAIRFVSFEYYRDVLGGWYNQYNNNNSSNNNNNVPTSSSLSPPPPPPAVTFFAGLLCGLTEAVAIVTPAEVCKIRMQSQYHSLMDPSRVNNVKYKNVVQTAMLVAKEEGVGALYKGVVPTMLRQGCNQAVNFTAYNWSKRRLLAYKKKNREEEMERAGRGTASSNGSKDDVTLDHWQSLMLGGLSGGMGPLVNNPLDVVKTRMQKQVIHPGKEPKYKSLMQSCITIAKDEGTPALWKGITPRLMRIMPGQAITFMTYEAVSTQMEKYGMFE